MPSIADACLCDTCAYYQYDCSGLLEDTPRLANGRPIPREELHAKILGVLHAMQIDAVLAPDHHELVMICVCDSWRCGTAGKNPDNDVAPVLVHLL